MSISAEANKEHASHLFISIEILLFSWQWQIRSRTADTSRHFPVLLFVLQNIGERISDDQLHEILKEVDLNRNAQVDIGEFLQVRG